MNKQFLNEAGLQSVADNVNKRLKTVETMPANPKDGQIVLYVGESGMVYTQGCIYQFDENEDEWIDITSSGTVDQSFNPLSSNAQSGIAVDEAKTVLFNKLFAIDTWKNNTWGGVNQFYNTDIWKLDDNIYLSVGSDHYVLNQTTMGWETKTWNGCSEFRGSDIWFQGNNVYLSFTTQSGEEHYVLNKATDTWEEKIWHNVSGLSGASVWKDLDGNIYNYFYQKLDVATDTWEDLTDFQPDSSSLVQNLFYYKNNIYYVSYSKIYLFNSSTRTWTDAFVSWISLNLVGEYIWTDGTNIYYSYFDKSSSDHRYSRYYILNQTTDEWETMTWKGDIGVDGFSTWTDGKDWYCSYYQTYPTTINYQLKLAKTLKTYID